MLTIDLLKGQGIPIKNTPQGMAVIVAITVVPAMVAIGMLGTFLINGVTLSVRNEQTRSYQSQITKYVDDVEQYKMLQNQRDDYKKCLAEINSCIGRFDQWSGILNTLVKNMPVSLVLKSLEIKQNNVKRKVPKKNKPDTLVEATVPVNILRLTVCGSSNSNSDSDVRQFQEKLRTSESLGPELENLFISQQNELFEGNEVIAYTIDCIFKPNMEAVRK